MEVNPFFTFHGMNLKAAFDWSSIVSYLTLETLFTVQRHHTTGIGNKITEGEVEI